MKLRKKPLSYDEWEVLRILWDAGKALTRTEIFEQLPKTRKWDTSMVSKLLTSMIEKDFIKIDGMTRCGMHSWGRTFSPTKEQFDFVSNYSLDLVSNVPKSKRITGLISSLISQDDNDNRKCFWKLMTPFISQDEIDDATIEKLKQLLSDFEKSN